MFERKKSLAVIAIFLASSLSLLGNATRADEIPITVDVSGYMTATFNYNVVNFGALSANTSNNPSLLGKKFYTIPDTTVLIQHITNLAYAHDNNWDTNAYWGGSGIDGFFEDYYTGLPNSDMEFHFKYQNYVQIFLFNYTAGAFTQVWNWTMVTPDIYIPYSPDWFNSTYTVRMQVGFHMQPDIYDRFYESNMTFIPILNYNVSVDTNTNYAVYACGSDFDDGNGHTFSKENLKIHSDESVDGLSLASAQTFTNCGMWSQVSNGCFTPSDTVNYQGFWLSVPPAQFGGSYNSTVNFLFWKNGC
jgi:hypothetical protein